MIQSNLWEKVGNRCLQRANSELENMEHLTEDGVGLVQKLVSIAIAIDQLNLQCNLMLVIQFILKFFYPI